MAALEAGHVEALRAMEREVESARAEAAAAETAAAASASAAEKSALSADAAFEEARRARMDFVDARDEAERLECLLEEEKRAKARAETRDAEERKPVTLHVTVVDDTAVCLTTVVQGVYDESDLEKARREASERATESTTALMESALESAVHIAREEAAAERDKALADSAKTHVAALEAAVVSARAEATASAPRHARGRDARVSARRGAHVRTSVSGEPRALCARVEHARGDDDGGNGGDGTHPDDARPQGAARALQRAARAEERSHRARSEASPCLRPSTRAPRVTTARAR